MDVCGEVGTSQMPYTGMEETESWTCATLQESEGEDQEFLFGIKVGDGFYTTKPCQSLS